MTSNMLKCATDHSACEVMSAVMTILDVGRNVLLQDKKLQVNKVIRDVAHLDASEIMALGVVADGVMTEIAEDKFYAEMEEELIDDEDNFDDDDGDDDEYGDEDVDTSNVLHHLFNN